MKAKDHSECAPVDCEAARQIGEDKETRYYEEKRKAKLPEALTMAKRDDSASTPEWRARKVLILETELLSARMEQVQHGDPMPLQPLRNVVGDALRLAESKNEKYRDAWLRQGYMGNLSRILSKTARLEAMLWRDDQDLVDDHDETVVDTLLDLINLSGFMAINFTEGRRWG